MSTPNPEQEILALRPDVVVTVLEREAVLLDLEEKYFYSVNASGWAIVQLFERGISRAGVLEQCRRWGAINGDATAIESFLDAVIGDRLVVPGGAAGRTDDIAPAGAWEAPRIEKHKEPLHKIVVSAFDPSIPLVE